MDSDETTIEAGRRLAVRKSACLDDWWVSHSPRNDSYCAEGTWMEWVDLAQQILAEHSKRVARTIEGKEAGR